MLFCSSVRTTMMQIANMLHAMPSPAAALRSSSQRRPPCSRVVTVTQAMMDRGGSGGIVMPPGSSSSKTAADIAREREERRRAAENAPGSGVATEAAPGSNRSFRPPPGFIDATMRGQEVAVDEAPADTEMMLNRLKAGSGQWHDLAKLLPQLARCGIDTLAVESATGLERPQQNILVVAASVYDSLQQTNVSEDYLEYFSQEGGENLLYELRFLPVNARAPPAIYMAENAFDQRDAVLLARAVKEHERRNGAALGFAAEEPGDCLAFKYYRDALETKKEQDRERVVQKGLERAATVTARAMLRSLLENPEDAAAAAAPDGASRLPAVQLEMVRFTPEELGVRPVAVAGAYGSVTQAELANAPAVTTSGVFGGFRIDATAGVSEWVALPAWNIILLARAPAVVLIPDCSKVPEIAAATSSKSEKDLARLAEPGLFVCSRTSEVDPDRMHLVAGEGGTLQLAAGGSLPEGAEVCAQVLFCCRPSQRSQGAASQTAELLQL